LRGIYLNQPREDHLAQLADLALPDLAHQGVLLDAPQQSALEPPDHRAEQPALHVVLLALLDVK